MHCFHLLVTEHGAAPDQFGMISPDLAAVTARVIGNLRDVAASRASAGQPEPKGWVEIADEEDRPLVKFSFAEAITKH